MIREKIQIPNCDYDEINSDTGRWSKETYAYWVAKFKTRYPTEGYGIYGVKTMKEDDGNCYICWEHAESCD